MSAKRSDSYFIAAGEHSGDLLGADLVLALREKMPKLTPFGVVGGSMLNAGVEEIANVSDFSVMGVTEVARRLAELRMLETRLLSWVDGWSPRFAVLIDNPGFHLRFAEQLRMRGVKTFQYVAPKLWAWGEGRAESLRANYDMVLGILPFEEEFFQKHGVNYTYVGSPLKDRVDKVIITRDALGLPRNRPVVACLPGSRPSELRLNLPTIVGVRNLVARALPEAIFVVPVAHNLALDDVAKALALSRSPLSGPKPAGINLATESWEAGGLTFVRGMSLEIMAAADAAIVASGTATLECALLGTPMTVVYSMSELSYQIARRVVKVPYASLVNLMAGRRLVNEFIQEFSLAEVADDIVSLLKDEARRRRLKESFEDIRDHLQGMAADHAASAIQSHLEVGGRSGTSRDWSRGL